MDHHVRSSYAVQCGIRALCTTVIAGALASACTAGIAWSQPGTLRSVLKINSTTLASVGLPLDLGDEFGDAVASLGDLDGPGPSVATLAVGAISDDDGGSHHGAVYLLFLNGAGDVLSYRKISSTQGNFTGTLLSGDEFGGAITNLGDLDGPGPSVTALAVGAIGDDDGGIDHGAVYVLFLNAAGSVLSYQKISSTQGNFTELLDIGDEFGGALAGLGDLDGPGPSVGAVAVGAVYDDDGGLDHGATYILFLNGAGSVLSSQKISDTEGNFTPTLPYGANFGEDVASLGDLDGSGPSVRALAVGTVGDDDGGNDRGAVYVLFLNRAGIVLSHQKISNTQGNFAGPLQNDDNLGSALASLGDLDGSGPSVAALAVGAASDDGLGLDRGAAYVLLLSSTGSVLSYQEISSTAGNLGGRLRDGDEFGSGLAAVGDIDGIGGGVQTLAIGVGLDDDSGVNCGAAYLLSLAGNAVVAVGDAPAGPRFDGLRQPRPDPFTRTTTIPFRIQEAGEVRIDVWDASGRRVRRLFQQDAIAGEHQVIWDGLDDSGHVLGAGTYYLRMSMNGRILPHGAQAVLLK